MGKLIVLVGALRSGETRDRGDGSHVRERRVRERGERENVLGMLGYVCHFCMGGADTPENGQGRGQRKGVVWCVSIMCGGTSHGSGERERRSGSGGKSRRAILIIRLKGGETAPNRNGRARKEEARTVAKKGWSPGRGRRQPRGEEGGRVKGGTAKRDGSGIGQRRKGAKEGTRDGEREGPERGQANVVRFELLL